MKRKNIFQLVLFAVLTFFFNSCRTEDEVLPNEEQTQFRVPIETFLKFEEKARADPEFRLQNKQQQTEQITQKNAVYTTIVNIPISQVSYKIPFRETIEAFFHNNPALGQDFYKDFGTPFYNVSTYTYGDSSKAIAFPILKGDQVTAFIHSIVTPQRDYVQFTIVQNNDPVTLRVLAILQDAVDNLYPKSPTSMGKFAKEQNIRVNDIEEITIIKFNVFSGGGGGFGYLFPGRDWWKDAQWKDPGNMHFGGGGKAMSGDGSKHKFPDYLDPNDHACLKVGEKNEAAKGVSGNLDFKNKKITATDGIANAGPEKGYIFGKDTSGNVKTGDVKTGTDSNISLPSTDPSFTVTGSAHTHTGVDSFDSFSPLDFYAMGDNLQTNTDYNMMFVFGATGEEYVLNIIDPLKLKNFVNLYKQSTNIGEDNGWINGTPMGSSFYNAIDQFRKQGRTFDEAYALANAYVLKKYDTGLVISRKDAVGNFNTLFVKEVKNSANANETNYEQTDNCNL